MPDMDEVAMLNDLIHELNKAGKLDAPIRSYERQGNKMILHLANGRTITESPTRGISANPPLDELLKAELLDLAREAGLEGYSNMRKEELIIALEEHYAATA